MSEIPEEDDIESIKKELNLLKECSEVKSTGIDLTPLLKLFENVPNPSTLIVSESSATTEEIISGLNQYMKLVDALEKLKPESRNK